MRRSTSSAGAGGSRRSWPTPRTIAVLGGRIDGAEVALRRTAVRAALATLSAREREIIALKFHAGLSNAELARCSASASPTPARCCIADGEAQEGLQCDGLTRPARSRDRARSSTRSTRRLAGEPVDPEYAELAELALLLSGRPAAGAAMRSRARSTSACETGLCAPPAAKRPAALVLRPLAGLSAPLRWPRRWRSSCSSSAVVACRARASSSTTAAPSARLGQSSSSSGSTCRAECPVGGQRAERRAAAAGHPGAGPRLPAVPGPAAPRQRAQGGPVGAAQAERATDPHRATSRRRSSTWSDAENGIVKSSSVTPGGGAATRSSSSACRARRSVQTMTALSRCTTRTSSRAPTRARTSTTQYVERQAGAGRCPGAADVAAQAARQRRHAPSRSTASRLRSATPSDRSPATRRRSAALNHQINYSQVSVTSIAGARSPVGPRHGRSGFTLGKAAHDAGRVLVVVAGVALIGLAVLLPVALVARVGWWVGAALQPPPARAGARRLASRSPQSCGIHARMAATSEDTIALLHGVPVFSDAAPTTTWRAWPRCRRAAPVRRRRGRVPRGRREQHVLRRPLRPRPGGARAPRRPLDHARPLRARRHLRRAGDVRRRAPLGDGRGDRGRPRRSRSSAATCAGCCASTRTSRSS